MLNKIMGWIGVVSFAMMALIMILAIVAGILNGTSAPITDWVELIVGTAFCLTGVYVSFDETRK